MKRKASNSLKQICTQSDSQAISSLTICPVKEDTSSHPDASWNVTPINRAGYVRAKYGTRLSSSTSEKNQTEENNSAISQQCSTRERKCISYFIKIQSKSIQNTDWYIHEFLTFEGGKDKVWKKITSQGLPLFITRVTKCLRRIRKKWSWMNRKGRIPPEASTFVFEQTLNLQHTRGPIRSFHRPFASKQRSQSLGRFRQVGYYLQ